MEDNKPYTIYQIAESLGARVVGEESKVVTRLDTLSSADNKSISFCLSGKFKQELQQTSAGAVIISEDYLEISPCTALIVKNPHLAYAQATALFARSGAQKAGIDKSAQIASSASIADGVYIGKNVTIADGVDIGRYTQIEDNSVIGENVTIGQGCRLYPNTTLYHDVILGDGVIVHSGAVIGADGFGFAKDKEKWHKVYQLGSVVIGNNVEIGSNSTVDRASLGNTIIEDGVKMDSQVHIAHNVVIQQNTVIAGQTGIAGSSNIGKGCMIGGGCVLVDNISIADNVVLSACTRVDHSIEKPGRYTSGTWAIEHASWKRSIANLLQLPTMKKKLRNLDRVNR